MLDRIDKYMIKGNIVNIQRFSLHDGPGIRTTVFFKGCPLNCVWCHNPESKLKDIELAYYRELCIDCGNCKDICTMGCHTISGGAHHIGRKNCVVCGKCVNACPKSALEMIGSESPASEILTETLKDRAFYNNSGGGITLSGGEPLYQPEFALELLKLSKENGLHTCLETSGFTGYKNLERMIPYTDLFLYDWKETKENLHKKFTGFSNNLIHENLLKLDKAGAKTILRCPVIPKYNDREQHYIGIAELSKKLANIVEINLLPYHTLGSSKCESIGRAYPLSSLPSLSDEEKKKRTNIIQRITDRKLLWVDHNM